jgi:hypothetical protein
MINYNSNPRRTSTYAALLLVHVNRGVPSNILVNLEGITRAKVYSWKKNGFVDKDKKDIVNKTVTTTKKLQQRYYNVRPIKKREVFATHDAYGVLCIHDWLINFDGKLIEIEKERHLSGECKPDYTLVYQDNSGELIHTYVEIETGSNPIDFCSQKIMQYNEVLEEDELKINRVLFYVPKSKMDKYESLKALTRGYELEIRPLAEI